MTAKILDYDRAVIRREILRMEASIEPLLEQTQFLKDNGFDAEAHLLRSNVGLLSEALAKMNAVRKPT